LKQRAQKFKDIRNIHALIIMHKFSGLPFFSQSYSTLMKGKDTLFCGFIQAVSAIGEEVSRDELENTNLEKAEIKTSYDKIVELNLKKFVCLILDFEELRSVMILRHRSSKRLKQTMFQFTMALYLKLSKYIDNWNNDLAYFNIEIPLIIYEYFDFSYKNAFNALFKEKDLPKLKRKHKLSRMELEVIKKILSIMKSSNDFKLMAIIKEFKLEEEDLIIDAIESLIEKELIVPVNDPKNN
jgi:hypothetical protein